MNSEKKRSAAGRVRVARTCFVGPRLFLAIGDEAKLLRNTKDETNATRNVCRGGFHRAAEVRPEAVFSAFSVPKGVHTEPTEPLRGLCVKSFSAAENTE